jgi:hypothetical protein
MMVKWTADDMPDQHGRTALVTGANSGLGWETALALARKGAHVVMACRSLSKGEAARDQIVQQVPGASLELLALDLGSLDSVREAAETFRAQHERLDLLFNNAGVMALPYSKTADGFEMQFGVNHLGHFALTGLLIDRLMATPGSRVVTTTSSAAFYGRIKLDDLNSERGYSRYLAYGQSKLANVLFAFELQRRLEKAGAPVMSLTAHPGFADTNLQRTTVASSGQGWESRLYDFLRGFLFQSGAMGALPQLYAATAPDARGGELYGPTILHSRGDPTRLRMFGIGYDRAIGVRLWQVSEQMTGVDYAALG